MGYPTPVTLVDNSCALAMAKIYSLKAVSRWSMAHVMAAMWLKNGAGVKALALQEWGSIQEFGTRVTASFLRLCCGSEQEAESCRTGGENGSPKIMDLAKRHQMAKPNLGLDDTTSPAVATDQRHREATSWKQFTVIKSRPSSWLVVIGVSNLRFFWPSQHSCKISIVFMIWRCFDQTFWQCSGPPLLLWLSVHVLDCKDLHSNARLQTDPCLSSPYFRPASMPLGSMPSADIRCCGDCLISFSTTVSKRLCACLAKSDLSTIRVSKYSAPVPGCFSCTISFCRVSSSEGSRHWRWVEPNSSGSHSSDLWVWGNWNVCEEAHQLENAVTKTWRPCPIYHAKPQRPHLLQDGC